jgi:energy-coupling factor transporter transmembrane protein EcfT
MSPSLRNSLANISFALGIAGFFSGTLLLCYCPGWFFVSALFFVANIWLKRAQVTFFPVLWLLVCLVFTGLNAWKKWEDHSQFKKAQMRYEKNQRARTNELSK